MYKMLSKKHYKLYKIIIIKHYSKIWQEQAINFSMYWPHNILTKIINKSKINLVILCNIYNQIINLHKKKNNIIYKPYNIYNNSIINRNKTQW